MKKRRNLLISSSSQHVIEVCILPRKELSVIYPELPHPSRLFLLETIYHALASTPESKATVSAAFMQYAAEVFKLKSDFMLHVLRRNEDVEPLEYTKMLEILASSSGSDKYVLMLQEDKSFLISTVCKFNFIIHFSFVIYFVSTFNLLCSIKE